MWSMYNKKKKCQGGSSKLWCGHAARGNLEPSLSLKCSFRSVTWDEKWMHGATTKATCIKCYRNRIRSLGSLQQQMSLELKLKG